MKLILQINSARGVLDGSYLSNGDPVGMADADRFADSFDASVAVNDFLTSNPEDTITFVKVEA